MKSRDIVMGVIIILVLIAGVLIIRNIKNKQAAAVASPTPSITQRINNTFPGLNIPENSNNIELRDVSGGSSFGVATPTEIVANLPQPKAGQAYQGWLVNSAGKKVLLGTFRVAKSGYILSYNLSKFSGYNKVLVTLNGSNVLEGSF